MAGSFSSGEVFTTKGVWVVKKVSECQSVLSEEGSLLLICSLRHFYTSTLIHFPSVVGFGLGEAGCDALVESGLFHGLVDEGDEGIQGSLCLLRTAAV